MARQQSFETGSLHMDYSYLLKVLTTQWRVSLKLTTSIQSETTVVAYIKSRHHYNP